MKFLFLFIVLINSFFFLWEYRKGAPEVYLKYHFEDNKLLEPGVNNIVLVRELMDVRVEPEPEAVLITEANIDSPIEKVIDEQTFVGPKLLISRLEYNKEAVVAADGDAVLNDFVGPLYKKTTDTTELIARQDNEFIGPLPAESLPLTKAESDANPADELKQSELSGQIEPLENLHSESMVETSPGQSNEHNIAVEPEKTLVRACYPLEKNEYKEVLQAQAGDYQLEFVTQEQTYISSYLVLTLPARSLQEAEARAQAMRQQGIDDLWLFRKGEFKWRISLGLFRAKEKALKEQKRFVERTTETLEVAPSHQTKTVTQVSINIEAENIADFMEKFSLYFDKNAECQSDETVH